MQIFRYHLAKTAPARTVQALCRPPAMNSTAGLHHAECMAAMRPPRTFSTFSVWRSQQEMTDMVHDQGSNPGAARHAEAMVERDRKDFHSKFTTLRFRALTEHGEWAGRRDIVPK